MKRTLLLVLLLSFLFTSVKGQPTILLRHIDRDTAYITDFYRKHLIIRAYESTKFNNFKFIDHSEQLVFKPNNHDIIGAGFNYRFISMNLGIYVPQFGKDMNIYGRTRQVDLQTHIYLHKLIVDLYGQYYHGYYLSNTDATINNYPRDRVETRPDIGTKDVSIVCQYVFNDKRFSYNAAFYQNEVQKKSAGSFLLGGGIYHTAVLADSALTPANIRYPDFFQNYRFNSTNNTALAFDAGYAYTLVIRKHFFITGILNGGCGINRAELSNTYLNTQKDKTGLELNLTERVAAGYNANKYFVGVTYIRLVTENNATEHGSRQEVNTGNFRFTVARRFKLKKALIPKSEPLGEE